VRISAGWAGVNETEVTGAEQEAKSELLLAGTFGGKAKKSAIFSEGEVLFPRSAL